MKTLYESIFDDEQTYVNKSNFRDPIDCKNVKDYNKWLKDCILKNIDPKITNDIYNKNKKFFSSAKISKSDCKYKFYDNELGKKFTLCFGDGKGNSLAIFSIDCRYTKNPVWGFYIDPHGHSLNDIQQFFIDYLTNNCDYINLSNPPIYDLTKK